MKAFDCSDKKMGHIHIQPWGLLGLSRSPSWEQWNEVCTGDPEELCFCFSSLTSCLHLPWHGEIASIPSLSVFIQTTNFNKVIFFFLSLVLRSLRRQTSEVIWTRTFYSRCMEFFHLNERRQRFEHTPVCLSRAVIRLNHSGNLEP